MNTVNFIAPDFIAILPLLILSGGSIVLMLQIAFWRNVQLSSYLTIITFALAMYSCDSANLVTPRLVTPLMQADEYVNGVAERLPS